MIFLVSFIVITYVLLAIRFYEMYQDYNDSAVLGGFYDVSNVPKQLYMAEMSDKVIDEALKMSISDIPTTSETTTINETVLKSIDSFLLSVLNKIIPGETHLFRIIDSKVSSIKRNVVQSKHLVYRDTKMYGFYIDLKTYLEESTVYLISYKINGLVFEDKINALMPSNLTKKNVFLNDDQEFGTYLTEYKIM